MPSRAHRALAVITMRILTVSFRRSVVVTLAALVFLSSIAALYRSDGPRRFQTKVYKYTEYYQDTSPHHTSTTSGARPIAPPGTERNGGLGEIYTNKAEWVAQKVKVANGEIKEWEKPDEERLKNDERRLMVCSCLGEGLGNWRLGDYADV